MKDKKSFVLYCDQKEMFEHLPDDLCKKLLMHLFAYVNDEDPQTDDPILSALFSPIKHQLKRDLKKWEERAVTSRENGKLGGRPKKPKETQNNPKKPSGFLNNPDEPAKPVNVNVTVNDNVNVINIDMDTPDISKVKLLIRDANDSNVILVFDGVVEIRADLFNKLLDEYSYTQVKEKVYSLSTGIHNKDKKYTSKKDHYRTILNWLRKDGSKKGASKVSF